MKIIYWSGTGNTKAMADYIAQGITESGKTAQVLDVSSVSDEDVKEDNILILGCPSMGAEVLEEGEFEPFVETLSGIGEGKKAVLFGSYGWGDGEWMRDFEERMKEYKFDLPLDSLIVNEMPEGDDVDNCINLGKDIAKL